MAPKKDKSESSSDTSLLDELQTAGQQVASSGDAEARDSALRRLAESYKLDAGTEAAWLKSGAIEAVADLFKTGVRAIQEAATKVLVRFATCRGPVQQLAFDGTTVQMVYNIIIDYDVNYDVLVSPPTDDAPAPVEEVPDPKAKKGAPPKGKVTPEASSVPAGAPGPSKQLLYTAIKIIDSLACTNAKVVEDLVAIGLGPVATLLEHHESPRIKLQAVKLISSFSRCVEQRGCRPLT